MSLPLPSLDTLLPWARSGRRRAAVPWPRHARDGAAGPWREDPVLEAALAARLAAARSASAAVGAVCDALEGRLAPVRVRACLQAAGFHPVPMALAHRSPEVQEALLEALPTEGERWSLASHDTLCFQGAALPPGLVVPGTLVLDQCPGEVRLPPDLVAGMVRFAGCLELTRLPEVPPGVTALDINHAPLLESLPDSLDLQGMLRITACPRLTDLPRRIRASVISISHCPGLRVLRGDIRCERLELDMLINLGELDLSLVLGGALELALPSLRTVRGRLHAGASLRIAAPRLEALDADLATGGDLVVEGCRNLAAWSGHLYAGHSLFVRGNPRLKALPEGSVVGTVELTDLSGLASVGAGLLTGSRKAHLRDCPSLTRIPGGRYRGSLELLDLPGLASWPEGLDVGNLTVLDCEHLPDLPPTAVVRTAFRRARPADRAELAQAIAALPEDWVAQAQVEALRPVVRALRATGVSLDEAVRVLLAGGEPLEQVLPAVLAEGYGAEAYLRRCLRDILDRGDLAGAARACRRAHMHPASLALVARDPVQGRWLAQLYSDSRDLALGLRAGGEGNLRLGPWTRWDLPEDLVVPGAVKMEGAPAPARWPRGLRTGRGPMRHLDAFLAQEDGQA